MSGSRSSGGGVRGGGERPETAYPVRKALGFTAEQWARVREFRFAHRFATEAEAARRLLDLGMRAVEEGLLLAQEGEGERAVPPSPSLEGDASS